MPPIAPAAQVPPDPATIAATPSAIAPADGFMQVIGRLVDASAAQKGGKPVADIAPAAPAPADPAPVNPAPANPAPAKPAPGTISPAIPDRATADPITPDPATTTALPVPSVAGAPAIATHSPAMPTAQGKGEAADKDKEPDKADPADQAAGADAISAQPAVVPVALPPPVCVSPAMPAPPPIAVAGTARPASAAAVPQPAAQPAAAQPPAVPVPAGAAAPPAPIGALPAGPIAAPASEHSEAPGTDKPTGSHPVSDDPLSGSPAPSQAASAPAPAFHPQTHITAAAPPAVPSQAAPPPPNPAAQAAAAIGVLLRPGESAHQLILRLDPAELGEVRIAITRPHDAPPSVALTVERPETLLLLLRDQPALHRALDQAGVPADGRAVSFHLAAPSHDAGTHADPGTFQAAPQMGGWQAGGWPQGQPGQTGAQNQRQPAQFHDPGQPPQGASGAPPPARRVWRRAGIDITA